MQVAGFDSVGLGSTRLDDSVSRNVSTSEKWVNFETDFDEEDMMQNDDAGVGGPMDDGSNEPMDDFQKIMKQLQQLQTKPLFTQDEEEEVKEDDDLFDDEDYEDAHSVIQKQKQNDQESKTKVFDDEDDDYYDDYSDEEFDGKKSEQKSKSPAGSSSDSANVMQDFIKGKTAAHRFKSRFDDFADDGEELLSSGSRKLRKNDSIKVISTPNGKVGIVYKVEPKSPEEDKSKKSSESQSGGTLEVHQKITPVMTADGKVALLYRGASDNSETFRNKYEPITNKDILTQLIDNNNKSTTSSSSSNVLNSIKNITTKNSIYNSNYDSYDSFNRNSNNVIIDPATIESDSVESSVNNRQLTNAHPDPVSQESSSSHVTDQQSTFTTTATMTTVSTTTTIASLSRPEDDTLNPSSDENDQERQENTLQINRPLSEVLGIKKNLYLDASVKIPNIETSTHKMRITNSNNLLSSLLSSINGNDNSTGSNRIVSNYLSKNFRNNANIEYEDRLASGDRRGFSVNGYSQSRFSINRRTTPPLPPRIIKEESEEEWTNDNSVPEVINLAIIPAFEHEIEEKYLRPHGDDHYYRRHKHHYNNVAPGHPTMHCAMQVIVACVVMGTFFGIAGAFFRSRIIDQIRILTW